MEKQNNSNAAVFHFDLFGKRDDKYNFLSENNVGNIAWNELNPDDQNAFLVPKDFRMASEYEKGLKVNDLFKISNIGIATGNDIGLVQMSKNELELQYNLRATKYTYRPFDERYTIFDKKILQRARYDTMYHLMQPNFALQITSKNRQLSLGYVFISTTISDRHLLDSAADSMSVFPLYLYIDSNNNRVPNFNPDFLSKIGSSIKVEFTNEKEKTPGTFAPIDILDYIYAVLHSPAYRAKYKEFLKIDFPRVPYPENAEQFWALVKLGGELRQLHLLESPKVNEYITQYPVAGDNVVEKISFEVIDPAVSLSGVEDRSGPTAPGRVYINPTQYFDNVPEVAWNFYIGGYQPAQKWLKDRKGRTLSFDDILHYQRIIIALNETERVMGEVDEII